MRGLARPRAGPYRLLALLANVAVLGLATLVGLAGGGGLACQLRAPGSEDASASPANTEVADAGSRIKRSVDLRSALVVAFPESRGVDTVEGTAVLSRRLRTAKRPSNWEALRAETLRRDSAWVGRDGGAAFHYALEERGDVAEVAVAKRFDGATIPLVLQAPAPISSEDLGVMLPPHDAAALIERQTYQLHVGYVTQAGRRAAVLACQVARLLLANGQWQLVRAPPGCVGVADRGEEDGLPERFQVELSNPAGGAALWAQRDGPFVDVLFELVTDAPGP